MRARLVPSARLGRWFTPHEATNRDKEKGTVLPGVRFFTIRRLFRGRTQTRRGTGPTDSVLVKRPFQKLVLPPILEKLLALPGGHLFSADSNVFMYVHTNIFVVGGPGMLKYTFPALIALLLVTCCSIGKAFEFLVLTVLVTPA